MRAPDSLLRFCAAFAVAGVLAGCAGYQLGDGAKLPFRTVAVAPPLNASLAPQVAVLVGAGVTREIDRSGQASIAPAASADVVLSVVVTGLQREISADRADDTGLARKWRVVLSAECTLLDRRSNRPLFEKRVVRAFDEVYADSGLPAAEYQNMPVLAGRLAEAIAREVLAVW
jgi:hypothetical protein